MAIQNQLMISPSVGQMCEKDTKRNHERTSDKCVARENNSTSHDMCGKEITKVDNIVSRLNPEEQESLARSSYRYLKCPVPSERDIFVRKAVRRCLEAKKGNVGKAFSSIQKLIKFREDTKVSNMITSFDDSSNEYSNDTARILKEHISTKKFYVQGFDKEGRSTLYFIPRNVVDHDLGSAIYSIERAIACSRSSDETVNCVVDFSDFPLSNSPSLEIGKQFLSTLRTIYVGHIHRIFLVNVPLSFSILWNVFSPFVGRETRDKITILKNNTGDKEKEILHFYDAEELPSWCVNVGKKNRSFDVDEYLLLLPFDVAFDSD